MQPQRTGKNKGMYQARGSHPELGRVHLGWFGSAEDAQEARRKFNEEHCGNRDVCHHPEHKAQRKVGA